MDDSLALETAKNNIILSLEDIDSLDVFKKNRLVILIIESAYTLVAICNK